jgi:hypothetical protein
MVLSVGPYQVYAMLVWSWYMGNLQKWNTKLIEVTHVFRLFQHVYIYIMHIIGIDISYLQLMSNKSLSGVIN